MKPSGRAKRADQRRILDAVVEKAKATGPRGIVVFDLDSTLLDNRPRQAKILAEYGASVAHQQIGSAVAKHLEGWDLKIAMRNAGVPDADIEQHYGPAREFWKARFFTSAYCVIDVPLDGAAQYLAALRGTGTQIAYVTGRHLEMGEGTRVTFQTARFPAPDGDRVHLLLKPTFEMHDDDWKAIAHAELKRLGEVVAAFDNEPSHVNAYAQTFPDAVVVHLDTDHSGRPIEVLPKIPSVLDFVRENS